MKSIEILLPDDWHVHFRDGPCLSDTVSATAATFGRALVMPNLSPALIKLDSLLKYRDRVLHARLPSHQAFTPYFTFYLSESTDPLELAEAKNHDFILGAKLYPAHVTTNSAEGVSSFKKLYPLFEVMQEKEWVLQLHGELPHVDIFDREAAFITQELIPLQQQFPALRIVLEHISTQAAVDFVEQSPYPIAATITPQHLFYNRNELLSGGIRPHLYCLPILKRQTDQHALIRAATSGHPRFFAGTDSAPHAIDQKESACGCAGIYSAPIAVSLYAQLFSQVEKLDKLEGFLSRYGAEFYQLPLNQQHLTLINAPHTVPTHFPFGSSEVVPMHAGNPLSWSIHPS